MQDTKANERTFQGILGSLINQVIKDSDSSKFQQITQEENVGDEFARFSDGLLYSSVDIKKKTLFELKNSSWDATDEILVRDAMRKAADRGIEYFVTGTPRQLVVYKTFEPNTTLHERKLKIYNLINVRKDDEIKTQTYQKQIYPKLKAFLKELEDIVHGLKKVQWDTIDKYFVNKLSAYILEASAEMFDTMYERIQDDREFQGLLRDYLKNQDIFNVTLNFHTEDVYNLCQLSNYLLYLKLVFYSYLQRDVPKLQLRRIEIPEETKKLNKVLREHFDDVLKHDYEQIFRKSVLDEFVFDQRYLPALKRNVEQIRHLNFAELSCDIMGAIYNTLIDNQEQHDRGQHFTNTNEVDIVNTFCITTDTKYVLDSGCGAGTFLVRAYALLKKHHPELSHGELLERLWGVEIAPFPAFLATMNLCLLNIATIDNYPVILQSDFSDIKTNSAYKLLFKNENKTFNVKRLNEKYSTVEVPIFDACVGNPPYIRQELIQDKTKWNNLIKVEFNIAKLNQQSNLYAWYWIHTAAFLKNGGRLGYVIFTDWMDSNFGGDLQNFLLNNFKIIAVIENQKIRSFDTASVNTVITILERCVNAEERNNNTVRFVRVYKDYDDILKTDEPKDKLKNVADFVQTIEKTTQSVHKQDYSIIVRQQADLWLENLKNNKYVNGKWAAKYLRAPKIYEKILRVGKDKLKPLGSNIVEIKYGIKTGANEFFYVKDDTKKIKNLSDNEYYLEFGIKREKDRIDWKHYGWYYSELTNKHYVFEKRFFKPLFKTQSEAKNLEVDIQNCQYNVLVCSEEMNSLRRFKNKLLPYIEEAESIKYDMLHKRPSVSSRSNWYNLGEDLIIGDFIFPSKIGEYFRLIDNRKSKIYCDKVNYNISVDNGYKEYSDIIFLILNSITFRYFIDLFARQMTGSQTLSDVDVNVVQKTLIIDPKLLKPRWSQLEKIYTSLKNREQGTIFEEIKMEDKRELDTIILETLGLNTSDVDELYEAAISYVRNRSLKSASVTTSKTKKKLSNEDSLKLIKERFTEIRQYDELVKGKASTHFTIPNLKPKFLKGAGSGTTNLFNKYPVYFKSGNTQTVVNFENPQQVQLYEWLYITLDIIDIKLLLPKSGDECEKILKIIKSDFKNYSGQINTLLKSVRSKANVESIYRDLLF